MEEEDYEMLRNEANAEPQRYEQWDREGRFRTEYMERHHPAPQASASQKEETEAPLSRQSSSSSTSIASSTTSASNREARTPELHEIRTAPQTPSMHKRGISSSSGGPLHQHPTERNPEAILRIETHRSQHQQTVGARTAPSTSRITTTLSRRKTEKPLPRLGAGKPYPPLLPDREEYVVEYDGVDDPLHAQNWPMKKKLGIGAVLAFDALSATVGSSIFSSAIRPVSREFGVIAEVGTLGTSLFVFGYAFGPLVRPSIYPPPQNLLLISAFQLWAPFSELYGRKPPLIIAAFGFSIFSIAVAVGKDLQTILICRFFAGLFGSCPLAVVAAVFADIFNNKLRGLAVAVFSATVFMGPLLAPFIGGFITISSLGWRWTEYISGIMGFASFGLLVLFLEETYPPVVLVQKAAELRRRTKNWGIHAKQEEIEVDFKELMVRNVSRPMRILFTEPIVLLIVSPDSNFPLDTN